MPRFCSEDEALALVTWGDKESVARCGPRGDTNFHSLFRRRAFRRPIDSSDRMEWRNMGGPVGESRDGKQIYGSPPSESVFVRLSKPPQPRPERIGSPSHLYGACRDGWLVAWGRFGDGKQEEIPTAEWADGRPEGWTKLRFDEAEVRRVFKLVDEWQTVAPGAPPLNRPAYSVSEASVLGTEAGAPRGGESTPGGALRAVEPAEPRDKTEAKRRSPGKPSKTTEIVAEFDRRCAANQCLASLTREAGCLLKWYSLNYATMPQPAHFDRAEQYSERLSRVEARAVGKNGDRSVT